MTTLEIPRMDAQAFRRRLADLEDYEATGLFSAEDAREAASDFCCALAVVFGRDLDRLTLWSRIGSAVETALPRAEGGDLERFEHHCLVHVRARISRVAASEVYAELTAPMRSFSGDLANAFVRYLAEHLSAAVIFGREKWEARKAEWDAERKRLRELDAAEEGGAE